MKNGLKQIGYRLPPFRFSHRIFAFVRLFGPRCSTASHCRDMFVSPRSFMVSFPERFPRTLPIPSHFWGARRESRNFPHLSLRVSFAAARLLLSLVSLRLQDSKGVDYRLFFPL